MKNNLMKMTIAYIAIVSLTVGIVCAENKLEYWDGRGRIVLSSDGNCHDNDDMQATMMTLMILAKAKLQSQTTLYTYADHVWGSEGDDLAKMRVSAEVTGDKFGFTKTKFMAAVEDPEAAYNAMAAEIVKSTAKSPLYIVAAGPMQVVGEAIDRASKESPESLNHIMVLSHSDWNNNHADNPHGDKGKKKAEEPHSGWTWKEMEKAFGDRVRFNRISDQNGTGKGSEVYRTKDKFSAPSWDTWEWMRVHADKNVRWIYEQARKNPCGPDFSDAGMLYYLVADLDSVRGDQEGNPEKLERWIGEKPFSKQK